jgi:hypothetical protein
MDRVMVVLLGLIGVLLASTAMLFVLSQQVSNNIARLGSERLDAYDAAWEIRYLDEVLTHSAARYAATGDPMWQTRYDDAVKKLDEALKTAGRLGGPEALKPLDDVASSNQALIDLETLAFQRGAAGDLAGATAALDGDYTKQRPPTRKG